MNFSEPVIAELDEMTVAYVSYVGNYMGKPEVYKELFMKLCGWAGAKGLITGESKFFSAYQDDPNITPPDELTLEVCMGIPEDVVPEGEVMKKAFPKGKYVVMDAELASPEEYGPAWKYVVDWMIENGVEIDLEHSSYEFYLNNPEEHPEGHHLVKICMSAK